MFVLVKLNNNSQFIKIVKAAEHLQTINASLPEMYLEGSHSPFLLCESEKPPEHLAGNQYQTRAFHKHIETLIGSSEY